MQAVSETVTGLTAGTKVYYRLCARNPDGTVQGQVKPYHHYANVVFVTSAKGTGNLGSWADAGGKVGREAGDNVCQTLAGRAGLQGTFNAWLSDSAGAARDRLVHSTAPYMKVDGVKIGNSWSDFTASPYLDNPIDRDENGVLASDAVHTETRVGGTTGIGMGGNACLDWVSSAPADINAAGWALAKDYRWTELGLRSCAYVDALYCFQQNFNLPQEHASTGCAGPIGWVWHVSACSKGLYQDPECKYVCCNFYNPTHNCNTIPATFGGYTVTGCAYNTGLYSMSVTHNNQSFTVIGTLKSKGSTGFDNQDDVVFVPGEQRIPVGAPDHRRDEDPTRPQQLDPVPEHGIHRRRRPARRSRRDRHRAGRDQPIPDGTRR